MTRPTPTTYTPISLHNFRQLPQMAYLSEAQRFAIEVVGHVLPFRVNNYVCDQLIDWQQVPHDPIFQLTFPQPGMLQSHHFTAMADLLQAGADKPTLKATANTIRQALHPHPAGQLEFNRPTLQGELLKGIQHKYAETILFFPSQGQTCHAYCTFCFRWPQFVGIHSLKFAMRETEKLLHYLHLHPEVSDVLVTGGDPLIMKTQVLAAYLDQLRTADLPHIQSIRLGTKALSFWPYRFTRDKDADALLSLFERVIQSGKHLTLMAHFNHPHELQTAVVQEAIRRIRATGAEIRTQSPLLRHINDDPAVWAALWQQQVRLGCVPYYMFVARDTGAQHYFAVPLVEAWHLFQAAYQQVSGLARTVRGPSMSTHAGKVHILGPTTVSGQKQIALQFLQAREPDWVLRPFFAHYDEQAIWFDQLRPIHDEQQFFFAPGH